jgi:hypothetical protein
MGSGGVPQLKGARRFSYEELKKYTNNFSEGNGIGSGGYGKVDFHCLSSESNHYLHTRNNIFAFLQLDSLEKEKKKKKKLNICFSKKFFYLKQTYNLLTMFHL